MNKKVEEMIKTTKAELLSTETKFKGDYISILEEKYKLPNGKVIKRERVYKKEDGPATMVVAKTKDNKYIMALQNRIANIVSLEFPGGFIDPGEEDNIVSAGLRELAEETGYVSNDATILGSFYPMIGCDAQKIYVILAKNCVKEKEQSLDETEYITYSEFTEDEVIEMIGTGEINGGITELAFYMVKGISNDK